MGKYLYRFGYSTPDQWASNEAHGWDDEFSEALYIIANSPDAALDWGREISEEFVRQLFVAKGWRGEIPSWKKANFAHWIDQSPDAAGLNVPTIKAGEFPEFSRWR